MRPKVHELVTGHRAHEQKHIEALRREVGSDVVAKLDTVVLRDLIAERRQRMLGRLLRDEPQADETRHRVMVNLRSGVPNRDFEDPAHTLLAKASGPRTEAQLHRRRQDTLIRGQKALAGFVQELYEEHGGRVEQRLWLTHSVVVTLTGEEVLRVAARNDVRSISHTKKVFALALDVSRPLVAADQVENTLGITGRRIRVGVMDTGVDAAHPALRPAMEAQVDLTGEGVGDLHGHGTHCAGTIASRDRVYRGVAPGARIIDIKIMDAAGSTDAPTSILGFQEAVMRQLDVLSNSWGFTHQNDAWTCPTGGCVLCVAADNTMSTGVTVVVAAGNENNSTCGTFDTHIRCPGNARSVITVGASDDADVMASFSSIGPTPDGRSKPEIVAPGVDIVACDAGTTGFVSMSGTSMACPHVAGTCALVLQAFPTYAPIDVKVKLMLTAVDIGATLDEQGSGRIDALAACT